MAAVGVVDRSQRGSVGHDRIERKPLLGDDSSHYQPEDIGNREAESIRDNGGFILGGSTDASSDNFLIEQDSALTGLGERTDTRRGCPGNGGESNGHESNGHERECHNGS